MSANEQVQLIIKRKKVGDGGSHHGGAWKVAYADFVTAMMAFFMLMWLLNATSDQQRKGIADYFSPKIPISETSGGGTSMFNGDAVFKTENMIAANRGGERHTDDPSEAVEDRPDRVDEQPAAETGDVGDKPETQVAAAQIDEETDPPVETEAEVASDEGSEEFDPEALSDEALEAAAEEKREREVRRVKQAFAELRESEEGSALLKHLSMRLTPDGLMIEITEREGEPLFDTGSAAASATMRELIEVVTPIVASLENKIAIVGHTDGRAYSQSSNYTNWDLSTDRANAARRLLTEFGLPPERLARITGAADRDPLSTDVLAPENRRIGITLLREPPKRTPTTIQE